jgi:hypothetical protein
MKRQRWWKRDNSRIVGKNEAMLKLLVNAVPANVKYHFASTISRRIRT